MSAVSCQKKGPTLSVNVVLIAYYDKMGFVEVAAKDGRDYKMPLKKVEIRAIRLPHCLCEDTASIGA